MTSSIIFNAHYTIAWGEGICASCFSMTHNEVLRGVYDSGEETATSCRELYAPTFLGRPSYHMDITPVLGGWNIFLYDIWIFRGCMVHKGKLCGMAAAALRTVHVD